MIYGYLGPPGTFSEEALETYLQEKKIKRTNIEKLAFTNIAYLMEAVGKEIDLALVPLENSLEGSVNTTIDSLIKGIESSITGELTLKIKQQLLAKNKLALEDIEVIYSHPQALQQCQSFIREKLPQAKLLESTSTARGAELALEKGDGVCCIGSHLLANIYGLELLARDIQERDNNQTRFLILSQEKMAPTGQDKTALTFSTLNQPSALYKALTAFAQYAINLTKIESRPSKEKLGEYVFYLEAQGHKASSPLKEALRELEENVSSLKILGSFPQAK